MNPEVRQILDDIHEPSIGPDTAIRAVLKLLALIADELITVREEMESRR